MAGEAKYGGSNKFSDAWEIDVKRELTVKEYNRLVRVVEMFMPDTPPPIATLQEIHPTSE